LIRHLLIATDFGPASERAQEAALDLARTFGSGVTVVHVIKPLPYPYPILPSESARQAVSMELDRVAAIFRAEQLNVDATLEDGPPWERIISVAQERKVDLLIMGTRGRRGIPHLLLGSVADKVVRLSKAPVLTVPPWRYSDRKTAGTELARAVMALREERPIILAISRGALSVANEVASALETSMDGLFVRLVECDGQAVGAVCEEGTCLFDEATVSKLAIPIETLGTVIGESRRLCRDESLRLRGARWIGDVGDRTVLVVTDSISSPLPAAASAKVLRAMGARRVVVATPGGTFAALEALGTHVDATTCLDRVREPAGIDVLYRDAQELSDAEAAAMLSGSSASRPSS
jgi:putative phosphoribosyl transferase